MLRTRVGRNLIRAVQSQAASPRLRQRGHYSGPEPPSNHIVLHRVNDIVDHILMRVSSKLAASIIRPLRVITGNPSKVHSLLEKKPLGGSSMRNSRDLLWFQSWLKDVFTMASTAELVQGGSVEGSNAGSEGGVEGFDAASGVLTVTVEAPATSSSSSPSPPASAAKTVRISLPVARIPHDHKLEREAYDALVKALQLATRYEHSSVLFSTGSSSGGGDDSFLGAQDGSSDSSVQSAQEEQQLASIHTTLDKFFHTIPTPVAHSVAVLVEDLAAEKFRAEAFRKKLKESCGAHTQLIEPLLTHLGIALDTPTIVKINKNSEAYKNTHDSILCELVELISVAQRHALAQLQQNPQLLEKISGNSKSADSAGDVAGDLSDSAANAQAAPTTRRAFGYRHCLKVNIKCVDTRSASQQLASDRAERVSFEKEELVKESRNLIASSRAAYLDMLSQQHTDVTVNGSSFEATSREKIVPWNTGLYSAQKGLPASDHANYSVETSGESAFQFRHRFMNVAEQKLKLQRQFYLENCIGKGFDENHGNEDDTLAKLRVESASSQDNGVATSLDRNKIFLNNLPEDITEEQLRYALRGYGKVRSVQIFNGVASAPVAATDAVTGRAMKKVHKEEASQLVSDDVYSVVECDQASQHVSSLSRRKAESEDDEIILQAVDSGKNFKSSPKMKLHAGGGDVVDDEDVAASFDEEDEPGGDDGEGDYAESDLDGSHHGEEDDHNLDDTDQELISEHQSARIESSALNGRSPSYSTKAVRGVNPLFYDSIMSPLVSSKQPIDLSATSALQPGSGSGTAAGATTGATPTPPMRNPLSVLSALLSMASNKGTAADNTAASVGGGENAIPAGQFKYFNNKSKRLSKIDQTSCVAFVTMDDEQAFSAITSMEVKTLNLCIGTRMVKVVEAKELRTLYVEILENLVVGKVVDLLRSVMGPWYDYQRFDTGNSMSEHSRPVFIHLSFDTHSEACDAYDQITRAIDVHTPRNAAGQQDSFSAPAIPLAVQWHKTQWYHQVASKASQMEFNAKRMVQKGLKSVP